MRSSRPARVVAFGIACLGFLCACGSANHGSLPVEVTNAIESAVNGGNVDACTDRFTDDAEVLQEDSPVVRGKFAIRTFCKAQIHPDLSLDTVSTMNQTSGELAFEQGTYRFRNVKKGVNVEYGEYLNIWKREADHWKIFRSMYDKTESLPTEVSVTDSE